MKRLVLPVLACAMTFAACTAAAGEPGLEQLSQQVENTERAFAKTMADRDFEAFTSFLSTETIFFSGETALRGSAQVSEAWKPYFEEAAPPFSWEPEIVEVLDSGTLALSSGPVLDATGNRVGTFNSIWRLDESGDWKVIFDKGNKFCEP